MIEIKNFTPREYQKNILNTAKTKNTLVCLPTGTGKTKIAILLAAERLNAFPETKILICSPTKPLVSQICQECQDCLSLDKEKINMLTGFTLPEKRKEIWNNSTIIIATPQTIENDLAKRNYSLQNVSLLVIDECHRSKMKFANTIVAKEYNAKATNKRLLALTASPGATKEKVQEICANLFIEAVEIRTETDEDLSPYIQEKEAEYLKVDLTPEIKKIQALIKQVYEARTNMLRRFGMTKPAKFINKADLLKLQRSFQMQIISGNKAAFSGMSITAQAIKASYGLELIETQGIPQFLSYLNKIKDETSKASKNIWNDANIQTAKAIAESLMKENILHPKLMKLRELLEQQYSVKPNTKAIIFSNYRTTVDSINTMLQSISGLKPTTVVGQKEGLTQKEQISRIREFEEGKYNVLIGTSITEEGLSISSLDLAIFYDHTASEIRRIQRSGRVARVKPGKIINLIAKNTRDEALMWTSYQKEKKMKYLLHNMKRNLETQSALK